MMKRRKLIPFAGQRPPANRFERLGESPLLGELLNTIEAMAGRIDDLEGQIESLESALSLDRVANVQSAFGIPETHARILVLLSDGMPHTKQSLHDSLYFRRPEIDEPELRHMDATLYQLRKAIRSHGVVIATIWGTSIQITKGLDLVQGAMETASIRIMASGTDLQEGSC